MKKLLLILLTLLSVFSAQAQCDKSNPEGLELIISPVEKAKIHNQLNIIGLLRHRRDHARQIKRQTDARQRNQTRRRHHHDGRPHRQGRHSRRDVFFGRVARRIAGHGRANRRPDHAKENDGLSASGPEPGAVPCAHGQRRGRAFLVGGRDGHLLGRLRDGSVACASEIRGASALGNSGLRGPGAHVARRRSEESRKISGACPQDGRGGDRAGQVHELRKIPHPLRRKNRRLSRYGFSPRRCSADETASRLEGAETSGTDMGLARRFGQGA